MEGHSAQIGKDIWTCKANEKDAQVSCPKCSDRNPCTDCARSFCDKIMEGIFGKKDNRDVLYPVSQRQLWKAIVRVKNKWYLEHMTAHQLASRLMDELRKNN